MKSQAGGSACGLVQLCYTVFAGGGRGPEVGGRGEKFTPMAGELSKEELVDGVRCLGVRAGDTVLVHSAMRTLGRAAV